MNGNHPTPLSTETKFSEGKRSNNPLKIKLVRQRILFINIIVDTAASERLFPSPFQGDNEVPDPMWKFTGNPRSCAVLQSGSQKLSCR